MANIDADIANTDQFKSFKCKAKLLGNTAARPASITDNGVLKIATTTVWKLQQLLCL